MSRIRLAFLGFRHGHIAGLYQSARQHPRVEVVAAMDEDAAAASAAGVTHGRYDDVLKKSPNVDAIAVGDYFGRRGEIIIRALDANKHVIADKPICTKLAELDRIAALAMKQRLAVGCLLDLRDHGPYITMRRLIADGAIGEVRTVTFTAQHPLMLGTRPAWYFEPGKHGGTINDIGIHAIDLIPWLTGRTITRVAAARAWNARAGQFPHFQDAAQVMLTLDNAGGVLGDLSYLAPDGIAYSGEQYWRVTCHGDAGVVETNYNARAVTLSIGSESKSIPAEANHPTGRLDAFLNEIAGESHAGALTTASVLDAARRTLQIQQAADENRPNVPLG
jgi:predicted dehydrogenase